MDARTGRNGKAKRNEMTKMMSRRGFLSMAAGTAGAIGLAACVAPGPAPAAQQGSPAEGVATLQPHDLTWWHCFTGPVGIVLEELVDKYNDENEVGISVNQEVIECSILQTKILSSWAAGKPPDVIHHSAAHVNLYGRKGLIEPLADLLVAQDLDMDDFFPEMLALGSLADTVYGMPTTGNVYGLVMNADYLNEAGLDVKDSPTDRAGFVEWCQTLTQGEGDNISVAGYGLTTSGGPPSLAWGTVLMQNGGSIMAEDGTRAAFNNEAGIDAAQWILDVFDKHKIGNKNFSFWDNVPQFEAGAIAVMIDSPRWYKHWSSQGMNLEVAILPQIGSERNANWLDMWHLMLIKNDDRSRVTAGAHFLKAFSDFLGDRLEEMGIIPPRESQIGSFQDPKMQPFMDSIKFGVVQPTTPGAECLNWYQLPGCFPYLDTIWTGEATIEDALGAFEADLNRRIRDGWLA